MDKHILFDLDGTLVYSHPGIWNSVKYALQSLDAPIPSDDVLMGFIGPPLEYSFSHFCDLSGERHSEAVRLFRERYACKGIYECALIPGVFEMLEHLKSRGCHLHLATSKPKEYVLDILKSMGIAQFFACIGAAPLSEKTRDKTTIINFVKRTVSIDSPEGAIMVGDRKEDVIGAGNTGIRFVGVRYGYAEKDEFRQFGAVDTVANIAELEQYLMKFLESAV